ncbi:hypothetical protein GCM10027168_45660 [Streptomyces capparidis]
MSVAAATAVPCREAGRDTQPAGPAPAITGTRARLVALLPAHNEQDRIAAAVAGLRAQVRQVDRIVVVADNCTDATAAVARGLGAEVLETVGNVHKKAGALNQAIDLLLPSLDGRDLLLIQDSDTVLNPHFAKTAEEAFTRRVGAVGGVFYGEQGGGLLGMLQRMEFHRYAWEIARKGGRAVVLTGTATVFRARVLREVRDARRSGRIGGGESYYSLASLTEDDEITKAVKTLGYRTMSPAGCSVVTEVMPTLPKLWHQRLRWQRGALENLRDYGWTRVTAPYFLKQILMGLGALFFLTYLVFLTLMLTVVGWPGLSLFWTAVGALFVVEKVVTVRRGGRRAVAVALLMIPEMLYDLFQHAVYFAALWGLLRRKQETWVPT